MKKSLETKFSTRQYMLARDFELYYYSDTYDSFERVLLHRHDYYEFYFFLEGDVTMQIGNVRHVLKSGDLVCIPPLIPHAPFLSQSSKPYRRFVFWISRAFLSDLRELSPDYAFAADWLREHDTYVFHFDPITFNYFQSKIIQLLEEMKCSRFGRVPMIQLKVDDLILGLSRYFRERVQYDCDDKHAYVNGKNDLRAGITGSAGSTEGARNNENDADAVSTDGAKITADAVNTENIWNKDAVDIGSAGNTANSFSTENIPSMPDSFLYDQIRNYIEEHLDEDLSLGAIADHFYLSRSYVSHLFRDQFGISVHQYILKKRLGLVRDQIASGMEITKACELAGFVDYTSFYRVFRKEYGMSPKQYQKKAAIDRKKLLQTPDASVM